MNELLEKAKSVKVMRRVKQVLTSDEMELAIEWAKCNVSLKQVTIALGIKNESGATTYTFLSRAFAQYIQNL